MFRHGRATVHVWNWWLKQTDMVEWGECFLTEFFERLVGCVEHPVAQAEDGCSEISNVRTEQGRKGLSRRCGTVFSRIVFLFKPAAFPSGRGREVAHRERTEFSETALSNRVVTAGCKLIDQQ